MVTLARIGATVYGLSRLAAGISAVFSAALTSALPSTSTFTRNDTDATVEDFEGLRKDVLAEEARFKGARRVENLTDPLLFTSSTFWASFGAGSYSLDTVNRVLSATSSVSSGNRVEVKTGRVAFGEFINGHTYTVSFEIKANSPSDVGQSFTFQLNRYFGTNSGTKSITVPAIPAEWTRYTIEDWTPGGDSTTQGIALQIWSNESTAFTVDIKEIQGEEIDGQIVTAPSEFVAGDIGADHGSNVDTVKYFTTQNGNTVSSDVVIEDQGAAIADATLEGVLIEEQRTNRADCSDDLSGGAETIDLTASGTGDYTLSVSGDATVQADAVGATISPDGSTATAGSPLTFDVSVAGTITLTLNAGSLAVAPNGSVVKQVEKGEVVTSWIPTTSTTAVTRNDEVLEDSASEYSETGSAVCEITIPDIVDGTVFDFGDGGTEANYVKLHVVSGALTATVEDGNVVQASITGSALTAGTYKVGLAWDANDVRMYLDGAADGTPDTSATMPAAVDITTFHIGSNSNSTDQLNGSVKNLDVYGETLDDATMQGLTS